jgi:hypothetical protein
VSLALLIACLMPAFAAADVEGPQVPASDVLLEVSADTDTPYVQARLRYRVRVLARVPLRDATFLAPAAQDAAIRRIGADRRFDVEQDGRRYRVSERLYVVVPERPGPLTIAGPRLSAAVPERALQSGEPGARIQRPAVITRSAPDLVLQVRPMPAAAQSPWLPAESVSISEHWAQEPKEVRVGELLERRIVIEAAGVSASALPLPEMPAVTGLRIYSHPPQHQSEQIGEDLKVTTTLRQTLVPILPGILTLPEVRLPWWNLGMDEAHQTSLPARQWLVVGEAAVPPEAPAASGRATWRQRFITEADATALAVATLPLGLGIAALTAWLLRRLGGRHRRGEGAMEAEASARAPAGVPASAWVRRFRRACEQNDAAAARTALAAWAASQSGRAVDGGLEALMAMRGAGAQEQALIRALDDQVYGTGKAASGTWQGAALLAALRPLLKGNRPAPGEAGEACLPPLFPTSSKG